MGGNPGEDEESLDSDHVAGRGAFQWRRVRMSKLSSGGEARENTPSFQNSRVVPDKPQSGVDPESIEGRDSLRWIQGQARDDGVVA
jgi:hypothetical protein